MFVVTTSTGTHTHASTSRYGRTLCNRRIAARKRQHPEHTIEQAVSCKRCRKFLAL